MGLLDFKNETLFKERLDEEECRRLVAWGLRHGQIHPAPVHVGQVRPPEQKKKLTLDCRQFDHRQAQEAQPQPSVSE